PIPAPREEGFTTTTGSPLYWAKYGRPNAPKLLVLHGGPGADHLYLLPQMLHLGEKHDLLFYDQRGGGRSKTDARIPITWETHVEDLGAVVEEFALDPLSIVGYSWGAMLTLLYVIEQRGNPHLRAPDRLALINPAPLTREYRRQFEAEFARRQQAPEIARMRDELAASGLRAKDPEAHRQRAFELGVAGYFSDPRNAKDLTPFRVVGRIQQSVWESLGDFNLIRDMKGIKIPSIVITGRDDPIPLASSSEAASALGTNLVVLDECGHVPYVEQPERLFEALDPFLNEPIQSVRS
ncbi:MAG TPA: alpha/beta fold hydrolase, partial [Gemmatimonadaceae bacterium]|nr:alpha/beta fold hydrolase [Gemmatimonadaceae bacterium]